MGAETAITMEELYSMYSATEINITLIAMIIGCLFAAFFSFRLLKITVIIEMICVGFMIGLVYVGLLTGSAEAGLAVGVLLAIVFGVLSLKFFKAMIYIYGAFVGAEIGYMIAYMIFDSLGLGDVGEIIGVILAALFAALGAVLLFKYFKPYVIIGTSLGGSLFATSALYLLIFGDNEAALGVFVILWLALGAVAAVAQFKMNQNYELEL